MSPCASNMGMFPLVRKHCCGGEKKERLRKASACKRQKEVGCFQRDTEVTLLCTRQTVTSLWCVPPFSSLILIEGRSPHESFQSHLSPPSSHAPALDKCRCILVYPSCSVSRVSKVERLWGCHSAKKPQQKSSVTPGMQRGRAGSTCLPPPARPLLWDQLLLWLRKQLLPPALLPARRQRIPVPLQSKHPASREKVVGSCGDLRVSCARKQDQGKALLPEHSAEHPPGHRLPCRCRQAALVVTRFRPLSCQGLSTLPLQATCWQTGVSALASCPHAPTVPAEGRSELALSACCR